MNPLNKYFEKKISKVIENIIPLIFLKSLENNSWETNDKFELKIFCFKLLLAKVWIPSEGLMHVNLKQSICIHSSCAIISKFIRVYRSQSLFQFVIPFVLPFSKKLSFEVQFFNTWKSHAPFLKYSYSYIPLTWWRHYIIYKVDYIFEYILNNKSWYGSN